MTRNRSCLLVFLSSFFILCAVLMVAKRGPFQSFQWNILLNHHLPSPISNIFPEGPSHQWTTLTPEEFDLFVKTIWGEARGEGYEGMCAVGEVILNRMRGNNDISLRDVILGKKQFSCWNKQDPNRQKLMNLHLEAESYALAQKAAIATLMGKTNHAKGATHYHAHYVKPDWAKGIKPLVIKGKHRFYSL